MVIATLQAIRTKIRRLTGSGTSLQLTDALIDDYINSFYSYDFPAQFRSLKLKDLYTFNTIRGIDTYPFDSEHYTTVEQPAYCMNRAIAFFNNPWPFYGVNYNWQYQNSGLRRLCDDRQRDHRSARVRRRRCAPALRRGRGRISARIGCDWPPAGG